MITENESVRTDAFSLPQRRVMGLFQARHEPSGHSSDTKRTIVRDGYYGRPCHSRCLRGSLETHGETNRIPHLAVGSRKCPGLLHRHLYDQRSVERREYRCLTPYGLFTGFARCSATNVPPTACSHLHCEVTEKNQCALPAVPREPRCLSRSIPAAALSVARAQCSR